MVRTYSPSTLKMITCLICKNYGEFLQYQIADVADKQAVEQAVKQFGAIDILLNTAGILDGYAKL